MAKNELALVAKLPTNSAVIAEKYVSEKSLSGLRFWDALGAKEKDLVLHEGRELAAAVIMHGASRLAIGAHLTALYEVLIQHKGAWTAFLKAYKHKFTKVTADRYMAGFKQARESFPRAVIEAAILRNMPILGTTTKDQPLGVYTSAVKALPPPPNPTPAQAEKYLDNLEAKRAEQRSKRNVSGPAKAAKGKDAEVDELDAVRNDPQFLLKHSFRTVKNNMSRLQGRAKRKWLTNLVGMVMTEAGITATLTVDPIDVPEDFAQGRGRPKLVTGGEDDAKLEATG